jgi:ankyrin repeat protein
VTLPRADGLTALHFAALRGRPVVIEKLVRAGAAVNAADAGGFTPLMLACRRPQTASSVESLLGAGADSGLADHDGHTALHTAAHCGGLEAAQLLLQAAGGERAQLEAKDSEGRTALHFAAYHGSEKLAALLLQAGADASAATGEGESVLELATRVHPDQAALLELLAAEKRLCAACGGGEGRMLECACAGVAYCSVACQRADWAAHKAECKRLRAAQRP